MAEKTKQVMFVLRNNVSYWRSQTIVAEAAEVLDLKAPWENLEKLMGRHALARHAILLDGALDRWNSEVLYSKRETEDFAGVAAATDESPPSAPRFRGLRFQVSVFYFGVFLDMSRWNSCADPIQERTCLADLLNCPGKKGVDVNRNLENDWGGLA